LFRAAITLFSSAGAAVVLAMAVWDLDFEKVEDSK
jgi:hypothetical protein